MGQTTFGEPLDYKVSQNTAAIEADEEAMAILATGDTHVAIEAGKYVYVRDHSTLARGLYKNTSGNTIAANDPLSSSNLTATTEGGLNELNSKIANLDSKIAVNLPNVLTYTNVTGITNENLSQYKYIFFYGYAAANHFIGNVSFIPVEVVTANVGYEFRAYATDVAVYAAIKYANNALQYKVEGASILSVHIELREKKS